MQIIKKNEVTASLAAVPFTSVDETDLQTRLDGSLDLSARIIKADQTSVAGGGNFDQPDPTNAPGCRRYIPSPSDVDVEGPCVIRVSATGMEPRELAVLVLPYEAHTGKGGRAHSWLSIKKGESEASRRSIPFTAVSSSNLQTRLDASLLAFAVRIIKPNGVSVAGAGTVVQPDGTNAKGCCFYVADPAELDVLGEYIVRISAPGMEPRELVCTVVDYDPYAVETVPNIANATTPDTIRNRIVEVIKDLTPTTLATNKFTEFRAQNASDLVEWAEENPRSAFRVFQVRFDGIGEIPESSNGDFEERHARFTVRVAYPKDSRSGKHWTYDLDKTIQADRDLLYRAIGLYSRPNFSPPHPDACFREPWADEREEESECYYLKIEVTYAYIRSLF